MGVAGCVALSAGGSLTTRGGCCQEVRLCFAALTVRTTPRQLKMLASCAQQEWWGRWARWRSCWEGEGRMRQHCCSTRGLLSRYPRSPSRFFDDKLCVCATAGGAFASRCLARSCLQETHTNRKSKKDIKNAVGPTGDGRGNKSTRMLKFTQSLGLQYESAGSQCKYNDVGFQRCARMHCS